MHFRKLLLLHLKVVSIIILSIGILNTNCFEVNGLSPTANLSIISNSDEQALQIAKARYMQEMKEKALLEYQKELDNKIIHEKEVQMRENEILIAQNIIEQEKKIRDKKKDKKKEGEKQLSRMRALLARTKELEKKTEQKMNKGLDESLQYERFPVTNGGTRKSYMAGTAITSITSEQWKLQHSGNVTLGNYGIQMVDDRYCAAIGSRFTTKIGTKFDVVLEDGKIIKCILADSKADSDTDETNTYHLVDGSVLEFVVGSNNSLDSFAKKMGDFNVIYEFEGRVTEIRVYE